MKQHKQRVTQHVGIVIGLLVLLFLTAAPSVQAASDQQMLEDVTKLLLGEISKLSARVTSLEQQNKTLTRMVANLSDEQTRGNSLSPDQFQEQLAKRYEFPKVVSFCNERVPMDKWDIWERLDSEFINFLADEKQVFLWLKRGGRYFPLIEEELKKAGLPDDLKYVTIIESGLKAGATSSAGAVGFWQFIESTGNNYGLEQSAWLDNRRDLYASTQAAIKYLKKLYDLFHDWPLALAAYNCGEGRVLNAMKDQGVHNYYQLELPRETERYVFKILAAKIILSEPKKYGFYIADNVLFPPHQVEQVKVQLSKTTPIRELAERYGSYYREFRLLNPDILNTSLPAGTYTIKVPQGRQRPVAQLEPQTPQKTAQASDTQAFTTGEILYTVKAGDSVSKIAQKFNVNVNAITKLDGKTKTLSELHPGDKLLIMSK